MPLINPVTATNAYGLTQELITANDNTTFATVEAATLSVILDGPSGESVLRQETTIPATTAKANLKDIPPELYKDGAITRLIRIGDFSNLDSQDLYLFRESGGGSYRSAQQFQASNSEFAKDNEWFQFQHIGQNLAKSGPAPDFDDNPNDIDRLSLWLKAVGATPLVADYGEMYGNVQHDKATIIISTDDSNDTDYTEFFPRMESAGFKGTCYQIGTIVGASGRVGFSDLLEMQAAGQEIATHASTDMSTLTKLQQQAEIEANKDALVGGGITGWRQFSYPLGRFNRDTFDVLNDLGFHTARTVMTTPYALAKGFNLYLNNSYGLNQTRVTDSTWSLDNDAGNGSFNDVYGLAKEKNLVMGFYVHRLQNTVTAGSGHTHIGAFQAVLDLIKDDVDNGLVRVVTMGQLREEASPSSPPYQTQPFDSIHTASGASGAGFDVHKYVVGAVSSVTTGLPTGITANNSTGITAGTTADEDATYQYTTVSTGPTGLKETFLGIWQVGNGGPVQGVGTNNSAPWKKISQ